MTKEKIKRAAIGQFAENGYAGATLGSIAEEVGIKTPSIYAFFASKEALYLAVFQEVLDEHYVRVRDIKDGFTSVSAEDTLYGILQKICSYHLADTNKTNFLTRAMLFPPPSLTSDLNNAFLKEEDLLSDLLTDIFKQGMAEGSIVERPLEDLLAAYFCLLDGVFLQLFYYSSADFTNRLTSSWNVFWNGISCAR